eukprot:TRINITY_DN2524_c0_g1_i1.p1 TRINITY_DN2524_c0_g1~~TRINITY_DN2524_c0_g1_i1.p1  ORF type:complete len:549 (+),score=145.56 TRINITY_DN2524_c0_g1_i1:75-1721(+)
MPGPVRRKKAAAAVAGGPAQGAKRRRKAPVRSGVPRKEQEDDAGSEGSFADSAPITANRDVLGAFIANRSDAYCGPDEAVSLGVFDAVRKVLAARRARRQPSAGPPPPPPQPPAAPAAGEEDDDDDDDDMEANLAWAAAHGAAPGPAAAQQPGTPKAAAQPSPAPSPFMRFMATPQLGPALGSPAPPQQPAGRQRKSTPRTAAAAPGAALCAAEAAPRWLRHLPHNHPVRQPRLSMPPAVALHLDLVHFLAADGAGRQQVKEAREVGQRACAVLEAALPASGPLVVGSARHGVCLRAALAERGVDVAAIGTPAQLRGAAEGAGWQVTGEGPGWQGELSPLVLSFAPAADGPPLPLHVHCCRDDAERAALQQGCEFIRDERRRLGQSLAAPALALVALLRQRALLAPRPGCPSAHVCLLITIAYLRHGLRASADSAASSGLGELFAGLLAFLAFQWNAFVAALAPADPEGRPRERVAAPSPVPDVMDPATGRNAAWDVHNWMEVRDCLEHCAHVLSEHWPPEGALREGQLHAEHPLQKMRPTPLSRLIR